MSYTERFSEVVDVLATLAPTTANGAVGAHNSAWASMADYHRAFALLHIGQVAVTGTLDLALYQATDSAGGGAKAISGKSITQLTASDDGYVGIELRSEELDVAGGFDYVRVQVTVGTDTFTYSLHVFGFDMRYEPAGVTDFQELVT